MRTDIASSSLRELDAVALATNVTIFMERGTYPRAELAANPFHRAGPQAKACGSDWRLTRLRVPRGPRKHTQVG